MILVKFVVTELELLNTVLFLVALLFQNNTEDRKSHEVQFKDRDLFVSGGVEEQVWALLGMMLLQHRFFREWFLDRLT